MRALLKWADTVADRDGPRYLAIAHTIERAITEGVLTPGDRLPPHRDLAGYLSLDVSTVSRAYAVIQRKGLTVGEIGRGTFVRKLKPDAPASLLRDTRMADLLDLSHNFPAETPPNPAARLIENAVKDLFANQNLLAQQMDIGAPAHRAAIGEWLAAAGIDASPAEVVISTGAQQGVLLALQAVSAPDAPVLVEQTTYYGALSAARLLCRQTISIEMDSEGMKPSSLEAALASSGSKVVYCNPTLHNPTTTLMGSNRRETIVALCRRFDAMIIEDDVYGFMLKPRMTSLCSLAPERTIYVSSFSKITGPGLRVGFMKAPSHLVPRIGAGLRASTLMAAAPMVELSCRLIRSGDMQKMADARTEQVMARQSWTAEVLQGVQAARHETAFHVWLSVGDWPSERFAAVARERGVAVAPGSLFSLEPELRGAASVRICVSAAPDRQRLQHGLHILRTLVTEGPYAARVVV